MRPPINDDGRLQPLVLELASDAKTAWVTFHDAIEEELGHDGELRDVRDVASKVADNAARLAALFHVFENGPQGQIGVDAINRACRIVAWHLHESRRFFGELMLPADMSDAVRLDVWLIERCRRHGVTSVAKNDVLQLGPNALRTKARRDAALDVLKELGRVRVSEEGNKPMIHVNPLLIEKTS
jgi:putative DNA primase/helicase